MGLVQTHLVGIVAFRKVSSRKPPDCEALGALRLCFEMVPSTNGIYPNLPNTDAVWRLWSCLAVSVDDALLPSHPPKTTLSWRQHTELVVDGSGPEFYR